MTLATRIIIEGGDLDFKAIHLDIENSILIPLTEGWESGRVPLHWLVDDNHIHNALGQGLPAILYTNRITGVNPTEGITDPEELEYYDKIPLGDIEITLDTGYSYDNPKVGGCADLHALIIAYIINRFPNNTVHWHNEFKGTWHVGTEGLDAFGKSGQDAAAWLLNTVRPAILGN